MGLAGLKLKVSGETCSWRLQGESAFQPLQVTVSGISWLTAPSRLKVSHGLGDFELWFLFAEGPDPVPSTQSAATENLTPSSWPQQTLCTQDAQTCRQG